MNEDQFALYLNQMEERFSKMMLSVTKAIEKIASQSTGLNPPEIQGGDPAMSRSFDPLDRIHERNEQFRSRMISEKRDALQEDRKENADAVQAHDRESREQIIDLQNQTMQLSFKIQSRQHDMLKQVAHDLSKLKTAVDHITASYLSRLDTYGDVH